jgi:hypothetical protein
MPKSGSSNNKEISLFQFESSISKYITKYFQEGYSRMKALLSRARQDTPHECRWIGEKNWI